MIEMEDPIIVTQATTHPPTRGLHHSERRPAIRAPRSLLTRPRASCRPAARPHPFRCSRLGSGCTGLSSRTVPRRRRTRQPLPGRLFDLPRDALGRPRSLGEVEDFPSAPRISKITEMAILVVDDDLPVRDALRRALTMQGYDVELAADGEEALLRLRANPNQFDLAIVDILMPRLDGLEMTRRLRADGNQIPILMLTARDQVADRVAGLEAGADDYLVKPFALEELVARVRALLRRLGTDDEPTTLTFADLELNTGTREVIRGGDSLVLTRTEFALLELFLRNPRQVLTRSVIFDRVWGYDFGYGSNSLDVYISYLRKKTEAGGKSRLIHTVRGVGYALREQ